MTQLDDIAVRMAAIEERMANLTVDDLPMAPLQRKLESDWHPRADLLEPGSISDELLAASILRVRGGRVLANGSISKGTGFTAAHVGAGGVYDVTFPADFGLVAAVVGSANAVAVTNRTISYTATSFRIGFNTPAGGDGGATDFTFIAIGLR